MSMCRVFSCVVGRGCLLWPVHFLGKILLAFALLYSVFQGQICLLLQVFLGEGNGTPLQCFCLENPRDGRAWWAAVSGVAQSQTRLKRLSSSSSMQNRKSRNTWSNSKFGLGVQNEAGQRLLKFCQKNALVIANTLFQKHKRRLYTWTWPDGQHQN